MAWQSLGQGSEFLACLKNVCNAEHGPQPITHIIFVQRTHRKKKGNHLPVAPDDQARRSHWYRHRREARLNCAARHIACHLRSAPKQTHATRYLLQLPVAMLTLLRQNLFCVMTPAKGSMPMTHALGNSCGHWRTARPICHFSQLLPSPP